MEFKKLKGNNFEIDIDTHNQVYTISVKKGNDFESTVKAVNSLITRPDFESSYNVIADLSEMDYHPTYGEVLSVKNKLQSNRDRVKNKIALVTNHKLTVVANLLSVYCRADGIDMNFFTNTKDAASWLNEISSLKTEEKT